jgi:N-acyl-D-aspartate/D-glutamate deacylase
MTPAYDLVVRGGTVVDGSGDEPFVGDVAASAGRVAAVGEVRGSGREEIDARGRIVTPGFVDLHTHYDGHATWGSRLEPSSAHGVTTVVMGNCGVGFAPCRPDDRASLVKLMEGVEDIPEVVMTAGLSWQWQSFPDYLELLDRRRFDMDVATQVPHAPLRLHVMGARALERSPATEDDVARMRALTAEAVRAGALGFSTSRSLNHRTSDGTVTPSHAAASDELAGIARGLRDAGTGVLQLISDFEDLDAEFAIVRRMLVESGRPLSLSLIQMPNAPERWSGVLDRIEAAGAEGLPIRGQVCCRPIGVLLGLELSKHPFVACAGYQEVARLALGERVAALRDPARRARILAEFPGEWTRPMGRALTEFQNVFLLSERPDYEPASADAVAARAATAGVAPEAYAYDYLTAGDGRNVFYVPSANYVGHSIAAIERMLASAYTVFGLGDGGAHCGLLCDASMTTYALLRWSDARGGSIPLAKVVRALTAETTRTVGLEDRGLLVPGLKADLNVIDLDRLALHRPEMCFDLPAGGGRLGQAASGYDATIVAGAVTYRDGVATGALPGRLVRGARR